MAARIRDRDPNLLSFSLPRPPNGPTLQDVLQRQTLPVERLSVRDHSWEWQRNVFAEGRRIDVPWFRQREVEVTNDYMTISTGIHRLPPEVETVRLFGLVPARGLAELFRPDRALSKTVKTVYSVDAIIIGNRVDLELAFQKIGLMKQLEKITLSRPTVFCMEEQTDQEAFGRESHLRMLDSLFASLNQVESLKELNVEVVLFDIGNLSANSNLVKLCQRKEGCKADMTLTFWGVGFSGPLLSGICDKSSRVTQLRLHECKLEECADEMALALKYNKNTTHVKIKNEDGALRLSQCAKLVECCSLESFECHYVVDRLESIDHGAAWYFANALANVRKLKYLDIGFDCRTNPLGRDVLEPLFTGIVKNRSLTKARFGFLNPDHNDDIPTTWPKGFEKFDSDVAQNTVLESFDCYKTPAEEWIRKELPVLSDKGKFWLELNKAGRGELLAHCDDHNLWLSKLIEHIDDTSICFYLLNCNTQLFFPNGGTQGRKQLALSHKKGKVPCSKA